MPNLSDLLPASAWPMQPFISPDEQARTLQAALSLGVPLDWSALLPMSGMSAVAAPSSPQQQPAYPATLTGDDSVTSTVAPPSSGSAQGASGPPLRAIANAYGQDAGPLGGILSAFFGPRADNAPAPSSQDGVVPKTLLPEFRMPPPAISDWQRPESYFQQRDMARIKRALTNPDPNQAGLGPIVAFDSNRPLRDAARGAEFLFPGSGNFVSGDWDNITGEDVARLALSAALTAGSFGLEGAVARAGAAATRRAVEEAEGADALARAARLSRARTSRPDPFVSKVDAPPQPDVLPTEPTAQPLLPSPPRLLALPPPPNYLALAPPLRSTEIEGPPASSFVGSRRFKLDPPSKDAPPRNPPGILDSMPYSGHALDQMQNRGLPPTVADQATRDGVQSRGNAPEKIEYYDPINRIIVVRNKDTGNVISVTRSRPRKGEAGDDGE